jgi:hypothetical protein
LILKNKGQTASDAKDKAGTILAFSSPTGERMILLVQIPITLAIIAWVPTNEAKLISLLILWALTFRKVSRTEAYFFFAACVFFTAMNAMSLKQGIFAFSNPDVLGMPWYELLMWGFYLLHLKRLLKGDAPVGKRVIVWALSLSYAAAFASISDASLLLGVTGGLLIVGLALFHEPLDLGYTAYFVLLGAAVEYTGVHSGQWHYPDSPPGGVPLWFITLWGGVGLLTRRLILPMLTQHGHPKVTQR